MITHPESRSLVTRDLLGDHRSSKQQLLPDLKENDYYPKRCVSPKMEQKESSSDHQTISKLQDLNKPPLNLFDDINLDLKLVTLSSSSSSQPYTLGKVKFALERAQKEYTKKRCISTPRSCTSSSFQETTKVDDETYATGCPSCLLYVLISRNNPNCPRCSMIVPSPTTMKKPRIDLNFKI